MRTDRKVALEEMRAAAKELDDMIASWGITEDELMAEYEEIRRAAPHGGRDLSRAGLQPRTRAEERS